ncbi:hypothetical protein BDF14DRAFT_1743587 [Spinellus fusiger]|nr:hypothetical protein BDF14DRAFT_1743587 [Spinellus fusiger]
MGEVKEHDLTLPLPPPTGSLFSDTTELGSIDTNDIFEKYMYPTVMKEDKENSFVSISVDDKEQQQQPSMYSTFQETDTLPTTLRESLRRKKSTRPSSIPVSQPLEPPLPKKESSQSIRQSRLPRPSATRSIDSSRGSSDEHQSKSNSYSAIENPKTHNLINESTQSSLPSVPCYSPKSPFISGDSNISFSNDFLSKITRPESIKHNALLEEGLEEDLGLYSKANGRKNIRPASRKPRPHSIVTNEESLNAARQNTFKEEAAYGFPLPQQLCRSGNEMDYFSMTSRTAHTMDSIPITPGSAHRLVRDSIVADDHRSIAASATSHHKGISIHTQDSGLWNPRDILCSPASLFSDNSSSSADSMKDNSNLLPTPMKAPRFVFSGKIVTSVRESKIPSSQISSTRHLSKRATIGHTSQIPTSIHSTLQNSISFKPTFDTMNPESPKSVYSQRVISSTGSLFKDYSDPVNTKPLSPANSMKDLDPLLLPMTVQEYEESEIHPLTSLPLSNSYSKLTKPFGNVDNIRKMLQATWNAGSVKESKSISSLTSSDRNSAFCPGFSPAGSINPRLQKQHLLSLSIRGHPQSPTARRPHLPIGFMDEEDSQGHPIDEPMPTISFSSSTVQTMIPTNDDQVPAKEMDPKKKQTGRSPLFKIGNKSDESWGSSKIKSQAPVKKANTIQDTTPHNEAHNKKEWDDTLHTYRRQPRGFAPWIETTSNKTPAQLERDRYLGST